MRQRQAPPLCWWDSARTGVWFAITLTCLLLGKNGGLTIYRNGELIETGVKALFSNQIGRQRAVLATRRGCPGDRTISPKRPTWLRLVGHPFSPILRPMAHLHSPTSARPTAWWRASKQERKGKP